ncbi:MAG: cytochrome c biogenesis protein CcsA [Gammaproteobacteria bacterium]
MSMIITGLIASIFYAASAWLQQRMLSGDKPAHHSHQSTPSFGILFLAGLALLDHAFNAMLAIRTPAGYDFGFFRVASLFSWVMSLIVVLASLKKPVANLFLLLFPLAIVSILCSTFLPSYYHPHADLSGGVALHSVLGILAFSLLTVAAIQALVVAWLSRELKHHHFSNTLRHMPPLQSMEELLFDIIKAGFIALLAVIISGFVFMDDMFGQHLAHKTVLTLASFAVWGILLWGRHRFGWRGKVALRWILGGFVVLILAYFGSKFVLEILLNRV